MEKVRPTKINNKKTTKFKHIGNNKQSTLNDSN